MEELKREYTQHWSERGDIWMWNVGNECKRNGDTGIMTEEGSEENVRKKKRGRSAENKEQTTN